MASAGCKQFFSIRDVEKNVRKNGEKGSRQQDVGLFVRNWKAVYKIWYCAFLLWSKFRLTKETGQPQNKVRGSDSYEFNGRGRKFSK